MSAAGILGILLRDSQGRQLHSTSCSHITWKGLSPHDQDAYDPEAHDKKQRSGDEDVLGPRCPVRPALQMAECPACAPGAVRSSAAQKRWYAFSFLLHVSMEDVLRSRN
jgi:hypothetical protein